MSRYVDEVRNTTHAVLDSDGTTPRAQRWAAFHARLDELPPEARGYVDKVARHAYRVTDEDVDAMKSIGWSEDAIFELTVAAAVGAAIMRLERGLQALDEATA